MATCADQPFFQLCPATGPSRIMGRSFRCDPSRVPEHQCQEELIGSGNLDLVLLRKGPNSRTPSIRFLGPMRLIFLLQAYCRVATNLDTAWSGILAKQRLKSGCIEVNMARACSNRIRPLASRLLGLNHVSCLSGDHQLFVGFNGKCLHTGNGFADEGDRGGLGEFCFRVSLLIQL